MNKLFTKIAALFLGMTMAVGVGVAVGAGSKASEVRADAESVDFTAQGYTNQQEITSYSGDNFSVAFNKGTNSNAPKYYTSGSAIRCYGGNYFTVESENTLTQIVLTFGSSDGSNAITTDVKTYSNGTWTGSGNSVKFIIGGTSGNRRLARLEVTYESSTSKTLSSIDVTSSDHRTFTQGDEFVKETITATYDDESTKDVTSDATFSGYNMSNVGEQTVNVSYTEGEVTKEASYDITVSAPLPGVSVDKTEVSMCSYDSTGVEVKATVANVSTYTYSWSIVSGSNYVELENATSQTVTIKPKAVDQAGDAVVRISIPEVSGLTADVNVTVSEPMTVAEALASSAQNNVYVKGIISTITQVSTSYGNATYKISDNGTTTSEMIVYRGKYLNNAAFTSADQIQIGDLVVVFGNLALYNQAIQLAQGNYLISLVRADSYDVSYANTETGSINVDSVKDGEALNATITPAEHYHLPSSLTSVTMNGTQLVAGSGYTYNNESGLVHIDSVTGEVIIDGACVEDSKYSVTYSAVAPGTGSYIDVDQYSGSYTLLPFSSLTGITYDSSTYRFKNYTVGEEDKNPGDSFTLSEATTVAVNFEEIPPEYAVIFGTEEGQASITDFSNTTIVCPSQVTLNNITGNLYGSNTNTKVAIRFGKSGATGSFDASISGNFYIVSVRCNLKYYGSDDTATFSVTPSGGTAISKSLTGEWADYVYDVSAAKAKKVTLGTDINGKRAFLSGFTIEYAELPILSSVTTSGQTTLFTAGNKFAYGGTLTAHYTAGKADATVSPTSFKYGDSGIDPTTDGTTITTNDTLIASTHHNKYIYVIYTEDQITKWDSYKIIVNYAPVTSVVLDTHAAEIGFKETFDHKLVGVTVNTEYAQQGCEWLVSANTVNGDYYFDEGGLQSGNTEGTITLRCRSTADNTKYDELVVTVSGDPTASFTPSSVSGYTGKSTDVAFTYSNMDDEDLISIASSNTSAVTVGVIAADEGNGLVTINFVGEGSSTLSIHYDGGSALASVVVTVSNDSVVALNWSASNIKVYSGTVLSADIDDTWEVNYEMASGDADYITYGDYSVKLGGSTITLPHTWSAEDNGKTLCVEYLGFQSSTVTVDVTQSLRPVMAPVPGEETTRTWTATAAANLGSVIKSVDGTDTGTLTFDDDSTMSYERTLEFVASGKSDYLALSDGYIQFGSSNALEKLVLTASTSGTVKSIDVDCWSKNGATTISATVGGNAFGSSQSTPSAKDSTPINFSGSATGTVVITMEKATKTANAQYIKSVSITTVESSGEEVNIANVAGHEAAQKVVVKFAKAFNTALGATENCTTGLSAAWSTASSAWNTFLSDAAALGSTEEAYAKKMIKYATAQWTEDTDENYEYCLERAMATYEYCVKNHEGCTAFMDSVRPVERTQISPITIFGTTENTNMVAIVVIVSVVSLTAIGGYFFLKKRREQN